MSVSAVDASPRLPLSVGVVPESMGPPPVPLSTSELTEPSAPLPPPPFVPESTPPPLLPMVVLDEELPQATTITAQTDNPQVARSRFAMEGE